MTHDPIDASGLIARFAALHPVAATALGVHDHDGRWGSDGAKGDAAIIAWVDEERTRLEGLDPAVLSSDDQVDRDLAQIGRAHV